MASLEMRGFDKLLSELDRMGRFEEVAPKMMDAGMEVLQQEVVEEASKHWDSGDMTKSIKPTGIMTGYRGGYYMCTRPTGYASRKGSRVRNMEKMAYLEYGARGRPATPVITSAVIRAEPEVIRAMREAFEREVMR